MRECVVNMKSCTSVQSVGILYVGRSPDGRDTCSEAQQHKMSLEIFEPCVQKSLTFPSF